MHVLMQIGCLSEAYEEVMTEQESYSHYFDLVLARESIIAIPLIWELWETKTITTPAAGQGISC